MNEVRDPLTREERQTYEQLAQRATALGCHLRFETTPKNGPKVWLLDAPGGTRALASLVSVGTSLRDFE